MEKWDVFHSDRLEVERGLSTAEVREASARGALRDDDLIRPAGTTIPWARLADMPALLGPPPAPPAPAPPPPPDPGPALESGPLEVYGADDDEDDAVHEAIAGPTPPLPLPPGAHEAEWAAGDVGLGRLDLDLEPLHDTSSKLAIPVGEEAWDDEDEEDDDDPLEEDEAAAEFTLARGSTEKVEELDLAAMVDVAFQLVLFFLVTATTVLYKSLEVPKPNPESPAAAGAQQGRQRSLDDLKDDYILVEIAPDGTVKIDREPVPARMEALVERLRSAREKTHRRAMLLSADFATPHRSAVLAYDAANEIGLGIAIARPRPPGNAPAPQKKAGG